VLCRLFPAADVPVVQLSLDRTQGAAHHYALAGELRALRKKGILILGSGNVVHNLYKLVWQDIAFDWAAQFDETVKRLILSGDRDALIHYEDLGKNARLAIPTNEHFLPLLYVLALREEGEPLSFFAEGVTLGTISMRAFRIG
jgi:4,5-DOPA dioxygenase extradiol